MPLEPATLGEITLDIRSLTLGEAAEAEMASGKPLKALLASKAAVRMLAIFVHVYRASGEPPSWSELSSLRILELKSSTSPSQPDGVPIASSD
jgi:hypothetical protein